MKPLRDVFFEDPDLTKPLVPLKCDYCGNEFSGCDKRDARKHLHDHIERMRKDGKGHGSLVVAA